MKSFGLSLFCLLAGFALTAQNPDARLELEARIVEAGKQKMLGNTEKAGTIYRQVLEKYPDNTLAAYELARILLSKGEHSEALKFAAQAAKGDVANLWYQSLYARVFAAMGRFREAAEVSAQTLRAFPGNQQLYMDLATYQEQAGQVPAAIKTFDEMEVRFGLQLSSSRKKAEWYMNLNEVKKAAREWENLCAAYPGSIQFLRFLANFYAQNGEKEKANATYRKILTLDPREPTALSALAGSNSPAPGGNIPQDIKTLIANRDLDAGNKIAKLKPYAERFAQGKETVSGTELALLANQIEELHPGDARAHAFNGEVLLAMGQINDAASKFRRSLQLEENQFPTWEKLLHIYRRQADALSLMREASLALEIFPNKPYLHYCSALAAFWQEKLSNAKNSIEEALFMGIQDVAFKQEVLSLKGLVCAAMQETEPANTAFSEAKAIFRETAILQARLALSIAGRSTDAETALQIARNAVALEPQNREALYALARTLYARNQYNEAKQTLEPIMPDIKNPLMLELWGDLLFKQGAVQEAISRWEQARATGNTSGRLMKKISDKQLYE